MTVDGSPPDTTTVDSYTVSIIRLPRTLSVGNGAVHEAPSLIRQLGSRVAVCTDRIIGQLPAFRDMINDLERNGADTAIWDDTPPELPLESVRFAGEDLARHRPDVIVGFGGGSAMDLAKLVALQLAHPGAVSLYYGENQVPGPTLPVVAIPTTAGTGSEVTPVAVIADPDRDLKVGVSSPYLIPDTAVVDPRLTHSCPATVTAHSGIDAVAHSVESATARAAVGGRYPLPVFLGSMPVSGELDIQAFRLLTGALRAAHADGSDAKARSDMAHGSLLAGLAFGSAGNHLAHALQYPIGATTHTPHGLGVGLLLPFVLRACAHASAQPLRRLATAAGWTTSGRSMDPVEIVWNIRSLALDVGIPGSLADIGVKESDLDRMADQTLGISRLVNNTPIDVDFTVIRRVLQAAWAGDLELAAG